MQTVARIGTYMLVFAAGGGIGTYFGYQMASVKASAREMAEVSHYSAYLDAQRIQGNAAAYEHALRGYLVLLESRSGGASLMLSDRAYAVDTALTYARLSVLASKRGAEEEAGTFRKKAIDLCPRVGWKDCSPAAITEMVVRLDKDRPTR